MSSTLITRPMDAEGKRLRRERVERLAGRVREHRVSATWADANADLELADLEHDVGGMSRYVQWLLCEIFEGEQAGANVHRTMLDGTLPEEHVEATLGLLAAHKMRVLGERTIVLHQLVVGARAELDALITAPRTEVQGPLEQAIAAIVEAEHAGQVRQAKTLSRQLADDAQLQGAGASMALGRARRDQARQVALGVIAPPQPPVGLRERVLAALRGRAEQPAGLASSASLPAS